MKSIKKQNKKVIIVGLVIVLLYLLVKLGLGIGNGPYANVEYYKFKINYTSLVNEIEEFKELHPELNPPEDDPIFGNVSYDTNDIYSPIFFYYPDRKYIILTFVFEDEKNNSSLGFYKIIKRPNFSTSTGKEINVSLVFFENIKQLKLFEERIVKPLHKQIREKYKHLKYKE